MEKISFDTVVVSDITFGSENNQLKDFNKFLDIVEFKNIYIYLNISDMKWERYFNNQDAEILRKLLLKLSQKNTVNIVSDKKMGHKSFLEGDMINLNLKPYFVIPTNEGTISLLNNNFYWDEKSKGLLKKMKDKMLGIEPYKPNLFSKVYVNGKTFIGHDNMEKSPSWYHDRKVMVIDGGEVSTFDYSLYEEKLKSKNKKVLKYNKKTK